MVKNTSESKNDSEQDIFIVKLLHAIKLSAEVNASLMLSAEVNGSLKLSAEDNAVLTKAFQQYFNEFDRKDHVAAFNAMLVFAQKNTNPQLTEAIILVLTNKITIYLSSDKKFEANSFHKYIAAFYANKFSFENEEDIQLLIKNWKNPLFEFPVEVTLDALNKFISCVEDYIIQLMHSLRHQAKAENFYSRWLKFAHG